MDLIYVICFFFLLLPYFYQFNIGFEKYRNFRKMFWQKIQINFQDTKLFKKLIFQIYAFDNI